MVRISRVKASFAFGAAETTTTLQTIHENGHVTDFSVVAGNTANVVTGTLTIEDEDGVVLYTKANIAKNATTIQNSISVPVDRGYKARYVLSGAPGVTGSAVAIKLWVDTGRK